MITNERQYKITRKKKERFVRALREFDDEADKRKDLHPRLVRAEREAIEAQLAILCAELDEYQQVKSAGLSGVKAKSIDQLPEFLIKARIASGLTQRELGERIKLKAQQIQRYEAERYASANFQRLCEVARALGVDSKLKFSA